MLNSYSDYNTGDAVGKRHTVNAPMSSETNKRLIYSWSVFRCLQLVHLELQAVVELSVGKVVPGVKYVFVMSCFVLKCVGHLERYHQANMEIHVFPFELWLYFFFNDTLKSDYQ